MQFVGNVIVFVQVGQFVFIWNVYFYINNFDKFLQYDNAPYSKGCGCDWEAFYQVVEEFSVLYCRVKYQCCYLITFNWPFHPCNKLWGAELVMFFK